MSAWKDMVYLLLFAFGICVGSFLSCLVYRMSKNASVLQCFNVSKRSVCDNCEKQLAWYDNLPLLSFVWLRGKSRCCHSPIPFQYFLTELACGFITVITIINFISIYHLLIIYLLIAIFLADLNYGIIPDEFAFVGMAIALFNNLTIQQFNNFWNILFSGLLAGFLFLFLHLITKRKGMGMGDAKLAVLMGLFLGFPKIVVALYFAFLTGAGLAVILILLGKKKLKSIIPFGPFLVAGTIFALFFGNIVWEKIIRALL